MQAFYLDQGTIMKRFVVFFLFLSFPSYSCLHHQSNHEKWSISFLGIFEGHEALTRFALKDTPKPHFFHENELIDGVRGSDKADFELSILYGKELPETIFDIVDSISDWHHHPRLQNLHFLRNKNTLTKKYESLKETCKETKGLIQKWSDIAFNLYRVTGGNEDLVHYLLGHILHIIQDSYSSAHTKRNQNNEITDVCHFSDQTIFDKKGRKICGHQGLQILDKDRIWKKGECDYNPFKRSRHCLSPYAEKAVVATTDYLKVINRVFHFGNNFSKIPLDNFFKKHIDCKI